MTVQCITCQHVNLRGTASELVKLGFAACGANHRPGRSYSITYRRDCAKHTSADPVVIAKRVDWAKAKCA